MSLVRPPNQPPGTLWSSLIQYYRACLDREQAFSVRVPADPSHHVILRDIDEHLISHKAITTILTQPVHTQPVLAFLNRRGRGISGTFTYGYPLVRHGDSLVPLCYTEVRLEPGSAPHTVVLTRGNAELLINRQFFHHEAGLTDPEVDDLLRAVRSPKSKGPVGVLDQFLLEVDLVYDAVLFGSEAGLVARGPGRELQLMEQLRKERLPDAIRVFIGEQGNAPEQPAEGLTILRADPAQEQALRRRRTDIQVVTGPAGSGKSQTAINLIATTLAEGGRVLYLNRDVAGADLVYRTFAIDGCFPGVLRIGPKEVRTTSLAFARQTIAAIREFQYTRDDPNALAKESRRLAHEVARLDAELQEARRLDRLIEAMTALARQVEESLAQHPVRRWAVDLSGRLTAESAGLITPDQLVGIRQLQARALGRESQSSLGGFLSNLGMRGSGQIKSGLKQLGVPEFCHPDGDLPAQVAGLIRLEQGFPLLLARARLLDAQMKRTHYRDLHSIQTALTAAWEAKTAVDLRRLKIAWLQTSDRARPNCDQLDKVLQQEEQVVAGVSQDKMARRPRYAELAEAFPLVVSQTTAVSGVLPNEPESFDLLVVDRASQIDLPSLLPLLYRARRACFLGDEHGPEHLRFLGEEEDNRLLGLVNGRNLAAYGYQELSALDRAILAVGREKVQRLTRQYRSPDAISDWVSEQFYEGQIQPMREIGAAANLLGDGQRFTLDNVADGQTIYPAPEAISQAQNPLEAKRVVRLVTQAVAQGTPDLSVITPFRGQAILIQKLLTRLSEMEPDPGRSTALRLVEVATPATLRSRKRSVVLLSTVVAPGATPETLTWLEKNRSLLAQAVSHATEQLVVIGHRETLQAGGPTLASLMAHVAPPVSRGEQQAPLPGLQPSRFGLLPRESKRLREALVLPGAVDESFSDGEKELFTRLAELVKGKPVLLAPRLGLLTALEPAVAAALPAEQREAAAGASLLLTLVHGPTLRPLVAVELDNSPELALKEAVCAQGRLPLVRIQPGQWQLLRSAASLVPVT